MKSLFNTAFLILLVSAGGPAGWAQKYAKRPASVNAPDGPLRHAAALHLRSLKSHPRVLTPAQAPAPAPGVAMCHVDPNGSFSGFFINTSTIASGSSVTGSITLLDDNSTIDFTGETLSQALQPGSLVYLPTITNFGDLWAGSGSSFDIAVQVQQPQGGTTEVDCTVLVGETLQNADLVNNEPLVSGVSQLVGGNNDLSLVLNGYFTPDPALVVLTDQYSIYVVPPAAVTIASSNEIDVDLSQVPGIDLTSSDTLFVTVSQDGYSDTVEYRYLPGTPGTFNPAPQ